MTRPSIDNNLHVIVARENMVIWCDTPMNISGFIGFPEIPPDLEHGVTTDQGDEGVMLKKEGRVYVCFHDPLVVQEGDCLTLVLEEPESEDECEVETLPAIVIEYSYDYNIKRVNPCDE